MTRIWIDVEDLFQHALNISRPSGIQRLAFEVEQAMVAARGNDSVRFLRYSPRADNFSEIPWQDVAALFASLTALSAPRRKTPAARPPVHPPARPPVHLPLGPSHQALRRASRCLPPALREPLVRALRLQIAFLGTLRQAARVQGQSWKALKPLFPALMGRPLPRSHAPLAPDGVRRFTATVRPGDMLLVLGMPLWHPDHSELVRRTRTQYGMRFGLLIYDLITVLHPEWSHRSVVGPFRSWFERSLPQADLLLAISQATARDAEAYAARHGIALSGPVRAIPIGTGFSASPAAPPPPPADLPPDLPPWGDYALFVSTIEVRKNHLLLFRVWQQLLAEMPRERVPKLVFAGRVGWMVGDLMAQLDNTGWLDGHIVLIENPSDADLAALYRGCLFTLFPSFYEGWGLPVTESLAFGKPCLTADNSSLPEAGGGLTRTFDADDLHSATRAIRETLEDRAGLAAWEARIRAEFHPVPWRDTGEVVLAACQACHAGDA